MAECAKISSGIALDCDNPSVAGVRDRLILFNFDDRGSITKDAANPLEVTELSLTSPALAYEFEGQNNSVEPNYSYVRPGFQGGFTHQVVFRVFEGSPTIKNILQDLTRGRVVAILINNDEYIEIYGYDTGLIIPDGGLVRTLNDAESAGGFTITLQNNELTPEKFMPLTYVGTSSPYDFSTALADIDGLLT